MESRGERFLYYFLAGSILGPLSSSFFTQSVLLLFAILTASFVAIIILCNRLPLIASPLQKGLYRAIIILFFLTCGILNSARREPPPQGHTLKRESSSGFVSKIRDEAISRTSQMIKEERQSSVAIALTIGEQGGIPKGLKKAFSQSGTLHTLALSGMHIGIIYNLISNLLIIFNISYKGRWIKLLFSLSIILFYSMVTGFSPSIQRAALMIFVYKVVELSGRHRGKWSALTFAASVILLINPNQLTNIGFQLSFMAVVGIITLYPSIIKSFEYLFGNLRHYNLLAPIFELMAMSTACQIATAPLAWYYFQSSPELFLISNIVAIPLVTLSIYLFPLAFIFTFVKSIENYPAAILEFVLKILNNVILYLGGQN